MLLHVLVGVVAYVFWPQPKPNYPKSLQVWLSEPQKPKAQHVPPTLVVESPTHEQGVRPDDAKLLSDFDHKAQQERLKKALAQDGAHHSKSEVSKHQPRFAQKGFKQNLKGTQASDDPLGLKPQLGDNHHVSEAGSDYISKMQQGDSTQLNTWQWQHAPFFNRIKSRIGKNWSPHSQIARFDPQGQQLGQMDRTTVLAIRIDSMGKVLEVLVQQPSGVSYLDEEAMRAVKEAAPFLYPPRELFDEQGQFSFVFAFHVLLNHRISLDFNW